MCNKPNEHLLVAQRGGKPRHTSNAVECFFDGRGNLRLIFYPKFWQEFNRFVGMNDHVRFYADDDLTYLRMQAQPVKGSGCYKMSKRPNCPTIRQIILPPSIASMFPRHEGRKALAVSEEQRSIVLSFQ